MSRAYFSLCSHFHFSLFVSQGIDDLSVLYSTKEEKKLKRKTPFTYEWESKPSLQKHTSQHRHMEKGNVTPLKVQNSLVTHSKDKEIDDMPNISKEDMQMIIKLNADNDNS